MSAQVGVGVADNQNWVKVGGAVIVELDAKLTMKEATAFGRRFMDAARPLVQAELDRLAREPSDGGSIA